MIARTEPGLRIFFPFFSGRYIRRYRILLLSFFHGCRAFKPMNHCPIKILRPVPRDACMRVLFRQCRYGCASRDVDSLMVDSTLVDSTPLYPRKIVEINYCGNRVTNPRVLRLYLGIDTGMVYDSALIVAGKKRLMDTYLFSKVEVLRLQKSDGVHVWVRRYGILLLGSHRRRRHCRRKIR